MFRIWDVRTFTTVQTFNCPLNEINCFAITQPPKRIIAGGRRMFFYDYDEPTDNHLADDQACLQVLYNPVFYTFVTAHPKCIKVWDATNGCLQSIFRDISSSEITCICFDKRNRKLFVGDQKGRIYCVNVKNGAKMKKFKRPDKSKGKEKNDVSSMIYWADHDPKTGESQCNVISASWDCVLRLWDDNNTDRDGQYR